MLQSLMIRLETTEDDKARLLETMKRYNEACNFVAKRAYSLKLANKYKLHKEVYHETRQRFGLSSQFVVRIIGKVVRLDECFACKLSRKRLSVGIVSFIHLIIQ